MKKLWTWLVELDRILRGEKTRIADLHDGAINIPLAGISLVLVLLGMAYGLCMGCYAVVNQGRGLQMLASVLKVPSLFLLTLAVTLPSLYVFNAIVGSRLTLSALVRLFIAALGVNMAVLASLGPIVAFFSVNTTSYKFMVLLNVVIFAVSGILSMTFLLQTLHRLYIAPLTLPPLVPQAKIAAPSWTQPGAFGLPSNVAPATTAAATSESASAGAPASETTAPSEGASAEGVQATLADQPGPLAPLEGHVLARQTKLVFGCWMIVFGLVGAQMSWVLRPFIGSPHDPFQWFRPRGSSFFEAVWNSIHGLLR